jgi:hypothetical protein
MKKKELVSRHRKKTFRPTHPLHLHPGPTLADVAGTRTVTELRGRLFSSSMVYRVAILRLIFSS